MFEIAMEHVDRSLWYQFQPIQLRRWLYINECRCPASPLGTVCQCSPSSKPRNWHWSQTLQIQIKIGRETPLVFLISPWIILWIARFDSLYLGNLFIKLGLVLWETQTKVQWMSTGWKCHHWSCFSFSISFIKPIPFIAPILFVILHAATFHTFRQ